MRTVLPKNAVLIPAHAKRAFKGVIFDVYQWQQKLFDGSEKTFEMLARPDTVKVIAIKDDKLVVLEERQPNHELFYDIPGGRHDNESETELEAAKRELLEETGLRFATWKLLTVLQPNTKIEQFVYIFFATDFINQTTPATDSGEEITVKLFSFEEMLKLAESPQNRHLPKEILLKAGSLQGLQTLPEFKGAKA